MGNLIRFDSKNLTAMPELAVVLAELLKSDAEFLRGAYPDFDNWFEKKVLPGLYLGERTVILEQREGKTVGILILKHSTYEKKICTLRVRPEFEKRGLGVRLFRQSFEILETEQPLLSVSEVLLPKFSKLFDYFGFSFEQSYSGLYLPQIDELSYNGILSKEN